MQPPNKKEALDYHSRGRKGKIEVVPTKPYSSQRDLSLAYSPGVAEPCLAIAENPDDVYKYTSKGNLVAVISNGSAVLGLGDIGPSAGKPVMEGKGVLFKVFADIDVFDIEVDATDVDHFVNTVKAIAPTFGGINLEDIKAPGAFEIERRLKEELDIPVMHDDQHGTAIISAAALLNALELTERDIKDVRIVVSGAGAAAMSCLELYMSLGLKRENIAVFDSKGHVNQNRDGLDKMKSGFATKKAYSSLKDALDGADIFLGLSKGGLVSADMIIGMAENPIVFALANPEPEIPYDEAIKAREDIIMATGRSDHPNQVNNVLGFPFIFRGALDVRATCINDEMKLAAVRAIASLAKATVPDEVSEAYDEQSLVFGKNLIIPKPLDPRLISAIAPAVAKAAIESGVAREPISDWTAYEQNLLKRLGQATNFSRSLSNRATKNPKRVVFAEAEHYKVLKAAEQAVDEGISHPILVGRREKIEEIIKENSLKLESATIIDPRSDEEEERRIRYGKILFEKRMRNGLTALEAERNMRQRNYFGAMMVEMNDADGIIGGISRHYPDFLRPCLETIGTDDNAHRVIGTYMMTVKGKVMFIGDATINIYPDARTLAEIAIQTARVAKRFGIEPRVALLSFSNFGSSGAYRSDRIEDSLEIARELDPTLIIDGPMQADTALVPDIQDDYPFMTLGGPANVLICPNLPAANISYKLLQRLGDAEMTGPILEGMAKPVHVLQRGDAARDVVHMAAICAVEAQRHARQRL